MVIAKYLKYEIGTWSDKAENVFAVDLNKFWDLFSDKEKGDKLWTFSSPKKDWMVLKGISGLALVRNKKVVSYILMRIN